MPDQPMKVKGFKVEISSPGAAGEVDSAWETSTGGALNIEIADSSTGSDQAAAPTFQTTAPGHKSIEEITLRGAMTDGRNALCDWINETLAGKDSRRTVTITEIPKDGSAGRKFIYHECFPVGYTFPRLDAGSSEPAMEEVRIKAIRLELA